MKTLYLPLLCLFVTFFCTSVRAQGTTASVTGRVMDEATPAEFTNVLLVASKDSQVVKLELADEGGHFTFRDVAPADYFIRTSGIGYADVAHPVFTLAAVKAQARHADLIDHRATSYAGAYWRNGFHEDGVVSALAVVRRLGVAHALEVAA